MDRDRTVICKIMSDMFDGVDKHGIYPTTSAHVSKLEYYIEGVRVEAIGWAHADNCVALDKGDDPRLQNVPEMLARAQVDLAS